MAALREVYAAGRAAATAAAVVAGLLVVAPMASADPVGPQAPCYNGIAPLNPYVNNCGIPSRPPRVMGSAPDQTAILNCSVGGGAWRAVCLSQYVNGGPFPAYPGIGIGFG
jgi:hypothetical protein